MSEEWTPRGPNCPDLVELGRQYTAQPHGTPDWAWAGMKGADARWRRVRTLWQESGVDVPFVFADGEYDEATFGRYVYAYDAVNRIGRGTSEKTEPPIPPDYSWGRWALNDEFVDGSLTVERYPGSLDTWEHGDKATIAWTSGNPGGFAGRYLPRPGPSAYCQHMHGRYSIDGPIGLIEKRAFESTISMTHVYWDRQGSRLPEPPFSLEGIPIPDGYRLEFADDAEWLSDEWTWTVEITRTGTFVGVNNYPWNEANDPRFPYRAVLYYRPGNAGPGQRLAHPLAKSGSQYYNDVYPSNWPAALFPSLFSRADNSEPQSESWDLRSWPFGGEFVDVAFTNPGGVGTATVTFTTPGGSDPNYFPEAEMTLAVLTSPQDAGVVDFGSGVTRRDFESNITTRVISVTRPRKHASWRLVRDAGGQYRLRQRQSATTTDSWPLRQKQTGGHTGSWPLRQRQTGV